MFIHQNDSSGKFWLSAFVVGLLIFFGQFASAQGGTGACKKTVSGVCVQMEVCSVIGCKTYDPRTTQSAGNGQSATDCQTACGGQCYRGDRYPSNGRCVCGNNYCLADACRNRNMFPTGSSDPNNRCSQTDPKASTGATSNGATVKNNCSGPDVEFSPANDVDSAQCLCKKTGQPVGPDGKCKEVAAKTEAGGKSLAQKCTDDAGGSWSLDGAEQEDDGTCSCPDGSTVSVISGNAKCNSKSAVADRKCIGGEEVWSQAYGVGTVRSCKCDGRLVAEVDNCNSVQATAPDDNSDYNSKVQKILDDCGFNEMQTRLDKCKEDSGSAVEKCEKEAFNQDKNSKQLGAVMQLISQVQQKKAVEVANPDVCAKAAYGATAAYWALDLFKKSCDEEVKTCKDSCRALKENESFAKVKNNCEQMYNSRILGITQATTGRAGFADSMNARRMELSKKTGEKVGFDSDGEAKAWIRNEVSEMERKSKDNLVKCESDAVKGEQDIAKYLAELLTASVSAAQCKNLASNIAARCANMASQLNPAYCVANPTEACCCSFNGTCPGSVVSIDCNGKDYATQQCVCARSPDSSGCKIATTTPALNLNNPGGVSTLTAPGGLKAGNQYKPQGAITQGGIDLHDSSDPGKPQQQASGGVGNPFGVANSGGGGGGGLPNSPNDGSAAPATGEGSADKSLVGGAFNQLKTLADRMFGTGSGNSAGKGYGTVGKDGKKTGTGVDPNKWKPGLRGLAGGSSPFGPRNKDIWKIMNAQYGIQNHTFIGIDGK